MTNILLVIHLIVAIALVAVILVQRSEGGGLGIGGGGGGGMSGFMTGRETANLLTRATAVLAAMFFVTSITFAIITSEGRESRSVIDGGTPQPAAPSAPSAPAAPMPPTGDQ